MQLRYQRFGWIYDRLREKYKQGQIICLDPFTWTTYCHDLILEAGWVKATQIRLADYPQEAALCHEGSFDLSRIERKTRKTKEGMFGAEICWPRMAS